jgi:hypothetical protein
MMQMPFHSSHTHKKQSSPTDLPYFLHQRRHSTLNQPPQTPYNPLPRLLINATRATRGPLSDSRPTAHGPLGHDADINLPSARPTNSKLHQMIHKRLQTNIIRKYRLRRLRHTPVPRRRTRMRRARVELRE